MLAINNYSSVRFIERSFGEEFFNPMHKPLYVYVTVCHDPHKVDWAFRLNGRPENDAVTISNIQKGKWTLRFIVPPSSHYQLDFRSKKNDVLAHLVWEEFEKCPVS